MYRLNRFTAVLVLLAASSKIAHTQSAQAVGASARIRVAVEARNTTRLPGHIPTWANAASDLGSISPSRRLDNLHLIHPRTRRPGRIRSAQGNVTTGIAVTLFLLHFLAAGQPETRQEP